MLELGNVRRCFEKTQEKISRKNATYAIYSIEDDKMLSFVFEEFCELHCGAIICVIFVILSFHVQIQKKSEKYLLKIIGINMDIWENNTNYKS